MTSKAVVETEGTTETTVAHHPRLLLTTQGEQVNPLQPPGRLMTHQLEVNSLLQGRGRNQSAPTVIDLVTPRTSASPRSEPSSPPVSWLLISPVSSQATSLKLDTSRRLNTTVPLWLLVQ